MPFTYKLQQFNKNASNENIKNELKSFAENWNKLKKSIPETYATIYMKIIMKKKKLKKY